MRRKIGTALIVLPLTVMMAPLIIENPLGALFGIGMVACVCGGTWLLCSKKGGSDGGR